MKLGFVVEVARFRIKVCRAGIAPTREEQKVLDDIWRAEEWECIKAAGDLFLAPGNFGPTDEQLASSQPYVTAADEAEAFAISQYWWTTGTVPIWSRPKGKR